MTKLFEVLEQEKVGRVTSLALGGFGNILDRPITLRAGQRLILTVTGVNGGEGVRYDLTAEDVIFVGSAEKQAGGVE